MSNSSADWLIMGNQLFPLEMLGLVKGRRVFMAEDYGLCTHFRYHKIKLTFFLSAMRSYADELTAAGLKVHYSKLTPQKIELSFEDKLLEFVKTNDIDTLQVFEIEDKFFETRIKQFCRNNQIKLIEQASPMFLVSRNEFSQYLQGVKKPFLKTFYEGLRKRRNLLLDADLEPLGGKFSFDSENRKKLPNNLSPERPVSPKLTAHSVEVIELINTMFEQHPGSTSEFWLPTTRREALCWLEEFLDTRLESFGPYEDAITSDSDFVFHSALSPLLNIGLLTPEEVLQRTISRLRPDLKNIASVEGFVRQICGWREFIRGIYQNFSAEQDGQNYWQHKNKLSAVWYRGTSGIPPLDDAIIKLNRLAYNHHIERLMLISNIMLLCEIDPREVYRWFMEMYVDSSDWVMGPNVYGMGQYSDGGIFATKPYICGSNYILKMSNYRKGEWCNVLDGLYWRFVEKNFEKFSKNPRTSVAVLGLQRINPQRKAEIYSAAASFLEIATA